jgi:hypothetical protein
MTPKIPGGRVNICTFFCSELLLAPGALQLEGNTVTSLLLQRE